MLFFACDSFCPQSVNGAKNQNSAQNLKTVTVSFGIFEAVFWEVENISASKTSPTSFAYLRVPFYMVTDPIYLKNFLVIYLGCLGRQQTQNPKRFKFNSEAASVLYEDSRLFMGRYTRTETNSRCWRDLFSSRKLLARNSPATCCSI